MSSLKTIKRISLTALFAAFTAAGAFIVIPVGLVPIVLQNLFAVLSGLILGPMLGASAVGLYLLAGLLNFPVFAGGGGGLVRFAGPTGGYLIGYLLAALCAGLIMGRPKVNSRPSLPRLIAAVTTGFLIVYLPGLAWLKISRDLSWAESFFMGFVPFIIGDLLKGVAAVLIAPRLRRITASYLD